MIRMLTRQAMEGILPLANEDRRAVDSGAGTAGIRLAGREAHSDGQCDNVSVHQPPHALLHLQHLHHSSHPNLLMHQSRLLGDEGAEEGLDVSCMVVMDPPDGCREDGANQAGGGGAGRHAGMYTQEPNHHDDMEGPVEDDAHLAMLLLAPLEDEQEREPDGHTRDQHQLMHPPSSFQAPVGLSPPCPPFLSPPGHTSHFVFHASSRGLTAGGVVAIGEMDHETSRAQGEGGEDAAPVEWSGRLGKSEDPPASGVSAPLTEWSYSPPMASRAKFTARPPTQIFAPGLRDEGVSVAPLPAVPPLQDRVLGLRAGSSQREDGQAGPSPREEAAGEKERKGAGREGGAKAVKQGWSSRSHATLKGVSSEREGESDVAPRLVRGAEPARVEGGLGSAECGGRGPESIDLAPAGRGRRTPPGGEDEGAAKTGPTDGGGALVSESLGSSPPSSPPSSGTSPDPSPRPPRHTPSTRKAYARRRQLVAPNFFTWQEQSDKNFYKDAVYVFYKKVLPFAERLRSTGRRAGEWLALLKEANPDVEEGQYALLEGMWDFYMDKFFVPLGGEEGEKTGRAKTAKERRKERGEGAEKASRTDQALASTSPALEELARGPTPWAPSSREMNSSSSVSQTGKDPPTVAEDPALSGDRALGGMGVEVGEMIFEGEEAGRGGPRGGAREKEEKDRLYAIKICSSRNNDSLALRIFREATWSNGMLQLFLHLCYRYLEEDAERGGGRLAVRREDYVARPQAEEVYAAREEHYMRKFIKGCLRDGVFAGDPEGKAAGGRGAREKGDVGAVVWEDAGQGEEDGGESETWRQQCEEMVARGVLIKTRVPGWEMSVKSEGELDGGEAGKVENLDRAPPTTPPLESPGFCHGSFPSQGSPAETPLGVGDWRLARKMERSSASPFSAHATRQPSSMSRLPCARPPCTSLKRMSCTRYSLHLPSTLKDIDFWDFSHPCLSLLLRYIDRLGPPIPETSVFSGEPSPSPASPSPGALSSPPLSHPRRLFNSALSLYTALVMEKHAKDAELKPEHSRRGRFDRLLSHRSDFSLACAQAIAASPSALQTRQRILVPEKAGKTPREQQSQQRCNCDPQGGEAVTGDRGVGAWSAAKVGGEAGSWRHGAAAAGRVTDPEKTASQRNRDRPEAGGQGEAREGAASVEDGMRFLPVAVTQEGGKSRQARHKGTLRGKTELFIVDKSCSGPFASLPKPSHGSAGIACDPEGGAEGAAEATDSQETRADESIITHDILINEDKTRKDGSSTGSCGSIGAVTQGNGGKGKRARTLSKAKRKKKEPGANKGIVWRALLDPNLSLLPAVAVPFLSPLQIRGSQHTRDASELPQLVSGPPSRSTEMDYATDRVLDTHGFSIPEHTHTVEASLEQEQRQCTRRKLANEEGDKKVLSMSFQTDSNQDKRIDVVSAQNDKALNKTVSIIFAV
ncbi:hypothetical protein NSK_003365 [Nannochloropsis salina CCMP1776]|uniref:Uncharacterized protein n=1 Tax=Nannochloropsis salina CCMP1776 TaxID=1027361 RepID=A0A4D9D209_9STRA|nr:hypothetical protein NSK_003365 [Nannochloropsis salina CCMP1776]|eukprot:TFJ85406.1 hypothetical protein NSK_003365 [Nannochloropsis salina CCMP1776]